MAKGKESFERRQRERAKRAKADAKRERRLTKPDDEDGITEDEGIRPVEQVNVLDELAALHADYDAEAISFDDFEVKRAELLSRLTVE